jgi:hypothetical protein
MPRGWFVPVKGSPAKERRTEVENVVRAYGGSLSSFWQQEDMTGYNALIEGVEPNRIHDLLNERELKYEGDGCKRAEIIHKE